MLVLRPAGTAEDRTERSTAVRGEEEQAESRIPRINGVSVGEQAVVLLHHVVDVLVGCDGYQGIELFVGELVLDGDVGCGGELGELGEEGGEGAAAVDGDYAGVAADVAELVVVGAGEDAAAEAAH